MTKFYRVLKFPALFPVKQVGEKGGKFQNPVKIAHIAVLFHSSIHLKKTENYCFSKFSRLKTENLLGKKKHFKTNEIQSITKKHVSPVFQPYVFPVYLRNRLSYKKSIYSFLYQFLKSSQLEQKFFKSDDTIS